MRVLPYSVLLARAGRLVRGLFLLGLVLFLAGYGSSSGEIGLADVSKDDLTEIAWIRTWKTGRNTARWWQQKTGVYWSPFRSTCGKASPSHPRRAGAWTSTT